LDSAIEKVFLCNFYIVKKNMANGGGGRLVRRRVDEIASGKLQKLCNFVLSLHEAHLAVKRINFF
jgi:hypothetical protein